ncbi:hypothetical protein R77569_01649 [Ralstonia mannitolilytica]|uniref:Integrase n=1 Tax=Ralstonia mannitolilytica TaxID=105219 RepID=A0ABM9KK52_9RALS|nr:hypothetical protein [Ralstonia mannitolilytica]CAJ0863786.1 hypothetical protein R77569_01649 [Ralstonia mannitolilytica]
MSIRANSNTKDQLPKRGTLALVATEERLTPSAPEDPLRFYTSHPKKPCFVDLTVFRDGEQQRSKNGGVWNGPYQGRALLIMELAPAIRDQVAPLAEPSVKTNLLSLRSWWRTFDAIEAADASAPVVTSTAHLSDVHRQFAIDSGMSREAFNTFLRLANTTRLALGLRKLHWMSPADDRNTNRQLPPQWQTKFIRHKLKHRWLAVLNRWALADELRKQGAPLVGQGTDPEVWAEQSRLLRNYQHFDMVVAAIGHPRPTKELLLAGLSVYAFHKRGYNTFDMVRGRYPDGDNIRAAFHLCLATTGWNPAVLLSLDVTDESFLISHPKDPGRYILRGMKARAGGSEQLSEGLYKSIGGAGFILQALIARTAPLREQLRKELLECKHPTEDGGIATENIRTQRERIATLEQGIRSPWLFVSKTQSGIQWLDDDNYSTSVAKQTSSYLGDLITNLNKHQPEDRQLALITATDFRDAYAAHVYQVSGGSVLAVMKALGHLLLSSTTIYLSNTLLKEEHRKLFSRLSNGFWADIEAHGRVDPTILAMLSRYGPATAEQHERLHEYRTLLRSRIGVACKDPLNPPKHIDPEFEPDGKSVCFVQRCTLCLENGVILPESMPGLCKRLAELRHLQATMSVGAFLASSYPTEITNTELALLGFDAGAVAQHLSDWESRISNGTHRVIEFDGVGIL